MNGTKKIFDPAKQLARYCAKAFDLISCACCLKHMLPEHYRLVIACLDAERPPALGVDQAQPVRLMTFVGADDRDMVMALPRGLKVNVALRAFYRREVESFTEMSARMNDRAPAAGILRPARRSSRSRGAG